MDMRPGDALFIPPLFPHLVRNFEGGSIAYGVNIISQASSKMMEEVRQLSPYDRAVFACHYLPADYPDEEWAANYSEETTEKALESCLQRVASVKPGLQETLRREAALKGREATVVTPTTPAVARPPPAKPPAQPFAATRIGGVTSRADMAKVAAAVARAAPPPEPPKARLPPHYQKRRSRSRSPKRSSSDDKKADTKKDAKKKRSRSRSRGRRRRKSPSRSPSSSSRSRSRSPKKRRAARSKSSSRSRSRSPKKRRRRRSRSRSRRKGRSRSPKRRKNRYDTALPSSSRSPPPRRSDRSRSRSRGRRRRSRSPKPKARYGSRQSRSPPPPAHHYGPAPPPPPPARSRYDTALPKRRGHELPARPHRYAHAPGAARTPSRSPPPTKPTLSLAEQAKAAARDASR